MDGAAFHELIAQVRGTTAALAEAEQKVVAFKAELARQDHRTQPDAGSALRSRMRTPVPKRVSTGWVPAD
jgi:hypothetical protein